MSKGKILVVDDDRLVLATLSYGLTQAGFEVTAKPGKEHMARVTKEVPMFAEIIAQAGVKKL